MAPATTAFPVAARARPTSAIISAAWGGECEYFEADRVEVCGHDVVASCNDGKLIY
jgi:hypothetical protein